LAAAEIAEHFKQCNVNEKDIISVQSDVA
jgi:hypothetical protein